MNSRRGCPPDMPFLLPQILEPDTTGVAIRVNHVYQPGQRRSNGYFPGSAFGGSRTMPRDHDPSETVLVLPIPGVEIG